MAKVYVVTKGEYSDYHIVGVFSTIELAEKVNKDTKSDEIEVYELDSENVLSLEYGPVYRVVIDLLDGSFQVRSHREWERVRDRNEAKVDYFEPRDFINCYGDRIVEKPIIRVASPFSFEHASKVAVEARQKWLRNGKKWEQNKVVQE